MFQHVHAARLPTSRLARSGDQNRKQLLLVTVSDGSMGEIQEVAVSLATANEISFDAVALVGVFTITEKTFLFCLFVFF